MAGIDGSRSSEVLAPCVRHCKYQLWRFRNARKENAKGEGAPRRQSVEEQQDPRRQRQITGSPLQPSTPKGSISRTASPAWERKVSATEGVSNFAPQTPGRSRLSSGRTTASTAKQEEAQAEKGPPLPPFGAWDATDPASADGFTVIFNKARDEKRAGGAVRVPSKFQSPAASMKDENLHKQSSSDAPTSSSSSNKWCCCCCFGQP